MAFIKSFLAVFIIIFLRIETCEESFQGKEFVYEGLKIKGLCVVAPPKEIGLDVFDPIKKVNAEWIAVTPYSFIQIDSARLRYSENIVNKKRDWHWWGETKIGVTETIKMAHQKGLKVMLKPHAWIRNEKISFTGDLDFESESKWVLFEKDFRDYLLDYAKVAHENKVEIYCIATEFKTFVQKRPQFWKKIIKEIKEIYKGKITYAENWDCFDQVPFLAELDFIGVDAYFPISDEKSPNKDAIKKGWESHLKKIEKTSRKYQKPILFTEFGYQSTDFSTQKPYESYSKNNDNEQLQADAIAVIFEEIWLKKYFAGGFVWKWFPDLPSGNQARDKYSPQNKKAEEIIRDFYSKK